MTFSKYISNSYRNLRTLDLERSRNYATLSLRFFSISGNLFPDIESLRRDVHCDTGKMLWVMDQGTFLYQNDVGVKNPLASKLALAF